MKRKLAGLAVVSAIFASVLFFAFASRQPQADGSGSAARPTAIEVTPVSPATLTETVSAVGTVAAMKDVVVSSETAGRVTAVFVKVGDYVRQGKTLVLVDDELKAIAVEQARAQLLAAETNMKKAQKDFLRSEKLFASGDIADVELEGYRLAYHSSEAQEKSASVALKLAQRQYEDTRIKAPISGFVASRKTELGEMVGPGREVANLIDISNVKVKVSIQEEEIGKLRLKQPVTLRVDSRPAEEFRGTVFTVGSKAETPGSHSYPVEVVVQNTPDDHVLKVGMFARVDIQVSTAKDALVISKESLVSEGLMPSVFVVENNIARLRSVKLGLRANDRVQVVDGLRSGDLVVSFGQKGLKDGSPVHYRQDGKLQK